jgi:hypothetical protein
MDLQVELAKIAEAYCLEHGLKVRRKFTDAELADTIENLRESKVIAERIDAQLRAEGFAP